MNVLVDTCIVIDYLQMRAPFYDNARDLVMAVAGNQINGYITAKSVTDIYYLMHRYFHDDIRTRNALSSLFKLFQVLDTTALDCQLAILSPISDYEDAVMVETAARNGIDCIVSRNIHDYRNSSVPVYLPQDFLQLL